MGAEFSRLGGRIRGPGLDGQNEEQKATGADAPSTVSSSKILFSFVKIYFFSYLKSSGFLDCGFTVGGGEFL